MPQAYSSVLWIVGMAVAATGLASAGLGLNNEPGSRRLALLWFALGHVMLGLMVWSQWGVYWRDHGLPLTVALAPLAAGIILFATTIPSLGREPDQAEAATTQRVEASYDEHIRQVARREERARLARDLHDAVKQQLFVIQTAAATAEARFDVDPTGAREAISNVRTAAREATTEMAALLDELQASPMENTGLVEALRKQCEALEHRTGAIVTFQPGSLPPAGTLRPGVHEAVYRVAQEALANIARHARATHVTVALSSNAERFELQITDDGSGLTGRSGTGMGISNMHARAAAIGGQLSITSRDPGTAVVLSVPLPHPAVRSAVAAVTIFGLFVLSRVVEFVIRGERP